MNRRVYNLFSVQIKINLLNFNNINIINKLYYNIITK